MTKFSIIRILFLMIFPFQAYCFGDFSDLYGVQVQGECDSDEATQTAFEQMQIGSIWQDHPFPLLNQLSRVPDACIERIFNLPSFQQKLRNDIEAIEQEVRNGNLESLRQLRDVIRNNREKFDGQFNFSQRINPIFEKIRDTYPNTNCPEKDISAQMPPIREQEGSGWCYAYTAADLLSFKLGTNVSAADTAIAYNDQQAMQRLTGIISESFGSIRKLAQRGNLRRRELGQIGHRTWAGIGQADLTVTRHDGGITQTAIDALQAKGGYCLESNLKSGPSPGTNLEYNVGDLRQNFDTIYQEMNSGNDRADYITFLCSEDSFPLRDTFDRVLVSDMVDIMTTSTFDPIRELVDRQCSPRVPFDVEVENHSFEEGRADGIEGKIQEILLSGRPAGVHYTSDFLHNVVDPSRRHASSVVGMRWNNETLQCEFKVRNSWGPDGCDKHRTENYDCSKGHFWVNEDVLKNKFHEVIEIK